MNPKDVLIAGEQESSRGTTIVEAVAATAVGGKLEGGLKPPFFHQMQLIFLRFCIIIYMLCAHSSIG
jgi:hypothetical protein